MNYEAKHDCTDVDGVAAALILKRVNGAPRPEDHRRAFEGCHTSVFGNEADRLIGFGRAISGGIYQAAVHDCAIRPECQGL